MSVSLSKMKNEKTEEVVHDILMKRSADRRLLPHVPNERRKLSRHPDILPLNDQTITKRFGCFRCSATELRRSSDPPAGIEPATTVL